MAAENHFAPGTLHTLSALRAMLDPASPTYDKSQEAFARNWLRSAYGEAPGPNGGAAPAAWLRSDHPNFMIHLDRSQKNTLAGRVALSGPALWAYLDNAYRTGLFPEYAHLMDMGGGGTMTQMAAPATPPPVVAPPISRPAISAPAPAVVSSPATTVQPEAQPMTVGTPTPPPASASGGKKAAAIASPQLDLDRLVSEIAVSNERSNQILDAVQTLSTRFDVLAEDVEHYNTSLGARISVLERVVDSLVAGAATIEHVSALQEGQRTLARLLTGTDDDFNTLMEGLEIKIAAERRAHVLSTKEVHVTFMSNPVYECIATAVGATDPETILSRIRTDSALRAGLVESLAPWLENEGRTDEAHRLRTAATSALMQLVMHAVSEAKTA